MGKIKDPALAFVGLLQRQAKGQITLTQRDQLHFGELLISK